MKENNFYSDDFEQLIRGKTEQYKMYPSENVWKGVHSALHTKRKWFIGSMAFLVTGILFMAGKELIAPARPATAHKIAAAAGSVADASKSPASENNTPATSTAPLLTAPLAALRSANPAAAGVSRNTASDSDPAAQEQDASYKGVAITVSNPVLSQSDLSEWLSHVVRLPEQAPNLTVIAGRITPADQGADIARGSAEHKETDAAAARGSSEETDADGLNARGVLENLSARGAQQGRNQLAGSLEDLRSPDDSRAAHHQRSSITGKDQIADSAGAATRASATTIAEAQDRQRVNWLRDYAMNILPPTEKRGRTFFQLTLAPTVTYRTLGGSDPAATKFYQSGGPYNNGHLGGPNDYVDHAPAIGFEFGGSILYRLTRNLSIKGGLQFNFSRYAMRAYASTNPLSNSAPNTYYGYMMDSLSTPPGTPMGGSKAPVTLNNDYFQISAPVGFELRVLGNERLQLNLGATVQPSYLLNTDPYLLTSGYTDYTRQPSWFRRWNVSGAVEAFLSYRTGNIRWQIGPEFRYQLLSSYSSQYPITENLKGYGLKIGITKMLP